MQSIALSTLFFYKNRIFVSFIELFTVAQISLSVSGERAANLVFPSVGGDFFGVYSELSWDISRLIFEITVLVIFLYENGVFLREKTESFPIGLLTDVVLPDILLKRLGGHRFLIWGRAAV